MGSGAQCVMTSGTFEMLQWFAGNWDSLEVRDHIFLAALDIISLFTLFSASYPLLEHSNNKIFRDIHLDNVACFGNETKLTDCSHLGIGNHNCIEGTEEAGVVCTSKNSCLCN